MAPSHKFSRFSYWLISFIFTIFSFVTFADPWKILSMLFCFLALYMRKEVKYSFSRGLFFTLSLDKWFMVAFQRLHQQCLDENICTLVRQSFFIEIRHKYRRNVPNICIRLLFLIVINSLQIVLEYLFAQS